MPNYSDEQILSIERSIEEKYGEDAVINPSSLWNKENLGVWRDYTTPALAMAHMLDLSHELETEETKEGMNLVAESEEGETLGIGWVCIVSRPLQRGKAVLYALGVDSRYGEDPVFFNTVVEEMLEFARKETFGDKGIGRISDSDVRI